MDPEDESPEAENEDAQQIPQRHDLRGSFQAPTASGGTGNKRARLAGKAGEKAHDYLEKKALDRFKKNAKGTAIDSTGTGVGALRNLKAAREKGLTTKEGLKEMDKAGNKLLASAAADLLGNPELTEPFTKLLDNKWKIWKWELIITIALLLLFFNLVGDDTTIFNAAQQEQDQSNLLQVNKTGPTQAKKGDLLHYTITVTYPGSGTELLILDPFPAGTEYVSSSPQGETNAPSGALQSSSTGIVWDTQRLNIPLQNPINEVVKLTLRATVDNTNLVNIASVSLAGGSAGGTTASGGNGYVPPNTDNCGGKYAANMAANYLLHKNFGDPQCNFTKDQLFTQLKQEDPQDASTFFIKVIPCESGYDPNAWASPATGTPNSEGAWGLFQMGDSRPPGAPTNASAIDDRGDVNFQLQTTSATKRAKQISSLGAYWQCAR